LTLKGIREKSFYTNYFLISKKEEFEVLKSEIAEFE